MFYLHAHFVAFTIDFIEAGEGICAVRRSLLVLLLWGVALRFIDPMIRDIPVTHTGINRDSSHVKWSSYNVISVPFWLVYFNLLKLYVFNLYTRF